jgi:hypothetical protein
MKAIAGIASGMESREGQVGVEYALSVPLCSIVSRVEFTLDCTMGTVAPKEGVAMKQTHLAYVPDLNCNKHRQQRA